jgi:hypothetical protein
MSMAAPSGPAEGGRSRIWPRRCLTIEDRTDRVTIYGNLDVTRDKAGLADARQLKDIERRVFRVLILAVARAKKGTHLAGQLASPPPPPSARGSQHRGLHDPGRERPTFTCVNDRTTSENWSGTTATRESSMDNLAWLIVAVGVWAGGMTMIFAFRKADKKPVAHRIIGALKQDWADGEHRLPCPDP